MGTTWKLSHFYFFLKKDENKRKYNWIIVMLMLFIIFHNINMKVNWTMIYIVRCATDVRTFLIKV